MTDHPNRKPTRLAGFNYAQVGAYFITLVTQNRQHLFGEVIDSEFKANSIGEIVKSEWEHTGNIRSEVELDYSCVMPNHFHAIVFFKRNDLTNVIQEISQPEFIRRPRSLGSLVAGFKSSVTTKVNQFRGTPGSPVWQRSYYDHIIRDETDLNRIREYIVNNPMKWDLDKEFTKK